MVDSARLQQLQDLSVARRGLFSTADAERIGIERRSLAHLERRGWVRRVRRGVYAMAGAPGGRWEAATAAAVALGPGAVLSHSTAAAIHGFDGMVLGTPELTVPGFSGRDLIGAVLHRIGPVPARDIVVRRQVPITSPARTVIDLAHRLGPDLLGAVLDEGVVRRLWTIDAVTDCLARQSRQRPGVVLLRQLLAERDDEEHPDSRLEQRILRYLDPLRPFVVHHQVVVFDHVYVVDAAWPPFRVAAEIDGRTYRTSSRTTFERETRKLNDLTRADWLVAHLSSSMDADACRHEVGALLTRRGAQPT